MIELGCAGALQRNSTVSHSDSASMPSSSSFSALDSSRLPPGLAGSYPEYSTTVG